MPKSRVGIYSKALFTQFGYGGVIIGTYFSCANEAYLLTKLYTIFVILIAHTCLPPQYVIVITRDRVQYRYFFRVLIFFVSLFNKSLKILKMGGGGVYSRGRLFEGAFIRSNTSNYNYKNIIIIIIINIIN